MTSQPWPAEGKMPATKILLALGVPVLWSLAILPFLLRATTILPFLTVPLRRQR